MLITQHCCWVSVDGICGRVDRFRDVIEILVLISIMTISNEGERWKREGKERYIKSHVSEVMILFFPFFFLKTQENKKKSER